MNNTRIIDINEISDSREVLSERPHRFIAWFVYALIAFIAVAVGWACVGEIDYYVKASGQVRPNDGISTIRNAVAGRVLESNLEEGQSVRRGDVLFSLDAGAQTSTETILRRQFESISNEINNLNVLRDSIVQGVNLFDENDPNQTDYYRKYEKFLTDTAVAVEQVQNTNLDVQRLLSDARTSSGAAKEKTAVLESELAALNSLLSSVDLGINLVPIANTEQYARYEDYSLNLSRYENLLAQKTDVRDRAEKLFAVGGVSKNEYENANYDLTATADEKDKYTSEFRLGILQSISGLESNLVDLNATIKSADSILGSYTSKGYSTELVSEKYRLDMLANISDTLFSLQSNYDAVQRDLDGIGISLEDSIIKAPIDGVVTLYTQLNAGDFIQAGTEVATIIPSVEGDYKLLLAVPNGEIGDISVGQKVNYRFDALPFSECGELSGRISSISTDARNGENGTSYYLVEAELNGSVLYNKKGEPSEIKVGMTAEARVITRSRKIIYWVLEKLNFVD